MQRQNDCTVLWHRAQEDSSAENKYHLDKPAVTSKEQLQPTLIEVAVNGFWIKRVTAK